MYPIFSRQLLLSATQLVLYQHDTTSHKTTQQRWRKCWGFPRAKIGGVNVQLLFSVIPWQTWDVFHGKKASFIPWKTWFAMSFMWWKTQFLTSNQVFLKCTKKWRPLPMFFICIQTTGKNFLKAIIRFVAIFVLLFWLSYHESF